MTARADFLRILKFQHPIIQAPLAGGGDTPELVAAVSKAGGLGFIGAAYLSPEQIAEAARVVKSKTTNLFGINLFAPSASATASISPDTASSDRRPTRHRISHPQGIRGSRRVPRSHSQCDGRSDAHHVGIFGPSRARDCEPLYDGSGIGRGRGGHPPVSAAERSYPPAPHRRRKQRPRRISLPLGGTRCSYGASPVCR
jgi:NAD(P)H-dependent flavin oxidoreductase YrpB (nitropropane dioxygenase family)